MVVRAVYNSLQGMLERFLVFRQKAGDQSKKLVGLGITKPHIWKSINNPLLDCDLNLHMNNSSFMYCCELSRWHLSGKNGLLDLVMKHKWQFMVGGQAIRYRRAIPPFSKYEISTVVDAFDDKWFYMTQTFTSPTSPSKPIPDKIYAQATIRAIVMKFDGTKISPMEIFTKLGIEEEALGKMGKPQDVAACRGLLEWDEAVDKDMKAFGKV